MARCAGHLLPSVVNCIVECGALIFITNTRLMAPYSIANKHWVYEEVRRECGRYKQIFGAAGGTLVVWRPHCGAKAHFCAVKLYTAHIIGKLHLHFAI